MPALNSNTGLGKSITNPVGSPLWNLRKELGIAQTPFGEISGDMISPKMWEARTGRKIKDLAMELGVFNEPGFAQPRSKTFRPSNFEEPSVGDVDASVKYKKYAGPSKYTGPSLADLEEEYDQMMREKYRKAKAENRALPGQVGNDRMYYIQSRMREYLSGNK